MKNPLSIITLLLLCILQYNLYYYYNDLELVKVSSRQINIKREGSSMRGFGIENYIIYVNGKEYNRRYKELCLSNWLWGKDDLLKGKVQQEETVYFYQLKSDKNLTKTSRYFLPTINKPVTNKLVLILDIWGYFMSNWFWRILLILISVFVIGELTEDKTIKKDKNTNLKKGLLNKIDTFIFKILVIIYILFYLGLFIY